MKQKFTFLKRMLCARNAFAPILILLVAVSGFAATANDVDQTFNPTLDFSSGSGRATAVQADGKILVGGSFKTLNGNRYRNIVRLNADNSIDSTFNVSTNGTVLAVAVQPDGKILIGGGFTNVNGTTRIRVARLNADGSLDPTFDPRGGADNSIFDIAVLPDGKIVVAGLFAAFNGAGGRCVVRLNADGTVDNTFTPQIFSSNAIVYSIAVQPDGRIIAGGNALISDPFSTTPKFLARLNTNGAQDTTFNPTVGGTVLKVALQTDGKILIGGSFIISVSGITRRSVARLTPTGALDAAFDSGAGASGTVYSIEPQANGKILIGGFFSTYAGIARNGVALLNGDGSLDSAFNLAAQSGDAPYGFYSTRLLPNGKVFAAGSFTYTANTVRNTAIIINSDGSVDSSLALNSTGFGRINSVLVQPDGKILVGGSFNRVNGVSRNTIVRFNADGSVDSTFDVGSGASGLIYTMVLQPDGKILVGGTFFSFNGVTRARIARLNTDGSVDTTFDTATTLQNIGVYGIAVQPDGKVLAVGNFTYILNNVRYTSFARLNANGSLDANFSGGFGTPPTNFPIAPVTSVVVQPDNKILIAGNFGYTTVGSGSPSVSHLNVFRINPDGTSDDSFVSATNQNSEVYALALQPDGKILIGGNIFVNNSSTATGAARLNSNGSLDNSFNAGAIADTANNISRVEDILIQPNGKILVGGSFTNFGGIAKKNVARLNADGALDNALTADTDDTVNQIALQTDGKILLAGYFETVNNAPRTGVARVLNDASVRRAAFDFDGDGKTDPAVFRPADKVWYLLGSQNGFSAAQFGVSSDVLVPADYDGDGKTDLAVVRTNADNSLTWFILRSRDGFIAFNFGLAGDKPTPADYDGDGKADVSVFRPSNGFWYRLNSGSNNSFSGAQFGVSEDVPVAADYDGDGKADLAVWRPSNGAWYLLNSRDGFAAAQFGTNGDKPTVGDYDGDGKSDLAVFRPSTNVWYSFKSRDGFAAAQWGTAGDKLVPGDYDGDGRTDIAVWRPSDGVFYILNAAANQPSFVQFGTNGDLPVAAAYIP